jgi:hypothetical protein
VAEGQVRRAADGHARHGDAATHLNCHLNLHLAWILCPCDDLT